MLILASKSPRRIEILKSIYKKDFLIVPSNIDERKITSNNLEDFSYLIAYQKGLDISNSYPNDYVLSADTTVIYNSKIFNKPKDEIEALNMLTNLNNQIHEVVTSYVIFLNSNKVISNKVKSLLTISFKDNQAIEDYIKTKSPFDKAGGYGIQDKGYFTYKIIQGSFDNIKGLPSKELKESLKYLKLI